MKTEQQIRQLMVRLQQIEDALDSGAELTDREYMQASSLRRIVERTIFDVIRRKVDGRDGTLAEWTELAMSVRLCHHLMRQFREDETAALAGWNHWNPQNEEQRAYSFLFDLLTELGEGAVDIEADYPEMAHCFEDFRDDLTPVLIPECS